jgi:hypothetical protein
MLLSIVLIYLGVGGIHDIYAHWVLIHTVRG